MSVFQLQEWWSVKVTQDATEEFDMSCFCIGNADNAFPISNKIVVGSQAGVLRMYHPSKPNYRIEDLVLEELLGSPILQVSLGRFIPGSELLGVAVLHPRELVVYEVLPQAVKDDRVSYYTLRKVYAHDLGVDGKHFTAFNMTFGAFGGVRGRDMILVQSMDGKLQIFEQSAHAFTRQLADCLLPGPITYVPKIDAFVTVNYAGQAECYRYQVLASSQSETVERRAESKSNGESKNGGDGTTNSFGIRAVRNTVCEWTTNIGDAARQLLLGSFLVNEHGVVVNSGPANELLILCEKSLFLVKAETGGIIQQRRIDRSDPSCACLVPFVAELPNGQTTTAHNFLMAGQDGTIQVYQGFNLVWAARLPAPPVYMTVSAFGGQRGLVVTIDDTGYLTISYLGTKPPVQAVLSQVRDLDYDKIDEEHRALLQIIRDSQSDQKHESQDRLLMKCQLPKTFEVDSASSSAATVASLAAAAGIPRSAWVTFPANSIHGGNGQEPLVKVTVRLYVTYTGAQAANQVSIVVSTPRHVHCHPSAVVLDKVTGARSTPTVVKLTFYALKSAVGTSMDVTITASYQSTKGEPGIVTHALELPFFLAVRPKAPTKAAPVKLILDTEYPAVPLTELFADVLYAFQETGMDVGDVLGGNAAQALAFQTHTPVYKIDTTTTDRLAAALKAVNILDRLATAANNAAADDHGASSASDAAWTASAAATTALETPMPLPETTATAGNPVVSILVSKNAGRYRIQSDSYAALALVCVELEKRLALKLATSPNTNLPAMSPTSKTKQEADPHSAAAASYVFYQEALPTDDFFIYVHEHLLLRQAVWLKAQVLQDRATQYRMIEKRLLVRFKDKNPTALHGLDVMLQDTYQQILVLADEIEAMQRTIVALRHEIEAFAKLLVTLIALKCRLSSPDRLALQAHLCPDLRDGSDQGWEETVTASLAHLLKTSLSRSGHKDGASSSSSSSSSAQMSATTLDMPKTIDSLRKNLLLVIDRLERGGRIVTTSAATLQATATATSTSTAANATATAAGATDARRDRK